MKSSLGIPLRYTVFINYTSVKLGGNTTIPGDRWYYPHFIDICKQRLREI